MVLAPVLSQYGRSSPSSPGPKHFDLDESAVICYGVGGLLGGEVERTRLDSFGLKGDTLLHVMPSSTGFIKSPGYCSIRLQRRVDAPVDKVSSVDK